jgi:hypothetical protein
MWGNKTEKRTLQALRLVINKKEESQLELILYQHNGAKKWYLLHFQPIHDRAGKVALFLMTFKNISHLKPKLLDSPRHRFQKIVRNKIMNKPSMDVMRENLEDEARAKKKGPDIAQLRDINSQRFIPEYGGDKVQTPRFVIKHFSLWKSCWDWFVLSLIFYTTLAVPYVVSFETTATQPFDNCVDVLFICDMVLTFFTTFVDNKGDLVVNLRIIRNTYLKGWFAVDLVAAIPWTFIGMIINAYNEGEEHKGTLYTEMLRGIKLLRLVRLGKISKKIERLLKYASFTLLIWILFFVMCAHILACIWYAHFMNHMCYSN